jgi:uncharacterized protein YqeY
VPSALKDRISGDVKDALKQGRKQELGALRLILSAIKQQEVDTRADVDDDHVNTILVKLAKQRRESIAQFETAGRDDLVAQERFELELLETYLPAALSEPEIEAAVAKAISESGAESPKDMGKVMGLLQGALKGRADMGAVSKLVKSRLAG